MVFLQIHIGVTLHTGFQPQFGRNTIAAHPFQTFQNIGIRLNLEEVIVFLNAVLNVLFNHDVSACGYILNRICYHKTKVRHYLSGIRSRDNRLESLGYILLKIGIFGVGHHNGSVCIIDSYGNHTVLGGVFLPFSILKPIITSSERLCLRLVHENRKVHFG